MIDDTNMTFTVIFRSESAENLDILAKKLQSVQDVDELTKMVLREKKAWNVLTLLTGPVLTNFSVSAKLRAASEYEERKMIRAAIRKIREEQQQGKSGYLMKLWASVQRMHLFTR